jgi:hypothetical protein
VPQPTPSNRSDRRTPRLIGAGALVLLASAVAAHAASTALVIALVWAAVATAVMALVLAAKHGDRALERASMDEIRVTPGPSHPGRDRIRWSAPVEVLPEHEELGAVAAHIRRMLGVERVSVILGGEPGEGVVAACVNAPGLLGERVPLEERPATGLLSGDEAAAMRLIGETPGGASWTYAHVPLHGPDGVTGAVDVAARRVLAFTSGEMRLIERLARRGAHRFERRRHARTVA